MWRAVGHSVGRAKLKVKTREGALLRIYESSKRGAASTAVVPPAPVDKSVSSREERHHAGRGWNILVFHVFPPQHDLSELS